MRSSHRRAIGPAVSIRAASPSATGNWPVFGMTPHEGLWPKTPLKKAGSRIEPPMSDPSPNGEPPLPTAAPSPPEEPPAVRLALYALFVRP
jgi:hypothetical protein